jgi:hypothetical protein
MVYVLSRPTGLNLILRSTRGVARRLALPRAIFNRPFRAAKTEMRQAMLLPSFVRVFGVFRGDISSLFS